MSTNNEVLTLVLSSNLHVAGEDIAGEVALNFRELQRTPIEEVHVKLRGSVFTYVVLPLITRPPAIFTNIVARSLVSKARALSREKPETN